MGTQTSKPLHGDEERRKRAFRRPQTPNNTNHSGSTTSISSTSTSGDNTWPCANCHATVSNQEARCPYCGGIQVKIPRSPPSTTKALNSHLLLERLAATPTTPSTRRDIHASKITAFLSETATSSTMDCEDEDDEEEEKQESPEEATPGTAAAAAAERPSSSLSQSSYNSYTRQQQSSSRPPSRPSPAPSLEIDQLISASSAAAATAAWQDSRRRPPDPVALTLEAAQLRSATPDAALLRSGTPSPQIFYEKDKQQHQIQPQQLKTAQKQQEEEQEKSVTKRKAASSGFEVPKKKMVLQG
jgi:hypothetical protein